MHSLKVVEPGFEPSAFVSGISGLNHYPYYFSSHLAWGDAQLPLLTCEQI